VLLGWVVTTSRLDCVDGDRVSDGSDGDGPLAWLEEKLNLGWVVVVEEVEVAQKVLDFGDDAVDGVVGDGCGS
jgi:hypothetical protein